ncbi:DNA-binding response regulator [Paenibacillus sp. YAF4_2]|uniref:DNA-binding response regulator n=1 Tax=Paenibacillus sp. YAF4_2 TaxID=3233085 RepID=UPI003F9889CC
MSFQIFHQKWYEKHLKLRKGKAKERLQHGHAHAEILFLQNVWYPAFRSFDHLHPEYEVSDFRDGTRFLDFAYIKYPLKLNIEIDGYGPHFSQASRTQFSDERIRQNHLVIDGWRILRFSYDDVTERPRMCEQIVQQFMSTWLDQHYTQRPSEAIIQQEVLRLALRSPQPIRPSDVSNYLNIHIETARRILRNLTQQNKLIPNGSGTLRVHSYVVNKANVDERVIL